MLVLSVQTISNWRVFVFVQVNCELKQVNLHIVQGGEGRRTYLELVDDPPPMGVFVLDCESNISTLGRLAANLLMPCHLYFFTLFIA